MATRVSANAIGALKAALSEAFWSKKDLLNYLRSALDDQRLLVDINWLGPAKKRDSVGVLVDRMAARQDTDREQLIRLMVDVANKQDYPELAWTEDADRLIAQATASRDRLRGYIKPYEAHLVEAEEAKRRIARARRAADETAATRQALAALRQRYMDLLVASDPVKRGYAFETLLRDLFDVFDLEATSPFRAIGEQIDGAFALGDHFWLLEARWRADPSDRDQLGSFHAKFERKSKTTLGLFVAINGFESGGVAYYSQRESPIFLMDGGDLLGVLDQRIDLDELIRRKRRHGSMTGEIYLPISAALVAAA